MRSFLFSVTNYDKMTLNKKVKAIKGDANYGPIFGGDHDLYICDKSNTINGSHVAGLGNSYENSNYKQGTK
jgi:hypothetical protein